MEIEAKKQVGSDELHVIRHKLDQHRRASLQRQFLRYRVDILKFAVSHGTEPTIVIGLTVSMPSALMPIQDSAVYTL